jgi:2-aminobenzoylacetyl-CoA thioesterase
MRSNTPGKICDGLWYLGRPESGVYLLEGRDESMIISGGMSYIAPSLAEQLNSFGLGEDSIRSILILHCHFDHIGVVPFLRQRNPDMRVYASERAWQILANPRSIPTINEFSRSVTERMGMGSLYDTYELDWPTGLTGDKVSDGDVINLGAIEVHILETPGHSSCSISAYVPKLAALFPSDGGGIPYKGTIMPSANSNFTQYMESLKKLEPLRVEYLCADHFGYVCGDEAHSYLSTSIELAEREHVKLVQIYRKTGDIESAAREVAGSFQEEDPFYFLTPEISLGVWRQRMKDISRMVDGAP